MNTKNFNAETQRRREVFSRLFSATLCLGGLMAVIILSGCGKGFDADSIWTGSYRISKQARTPKGALVYSGKDIDARLFPEMDAGIDDLTISARAEGYQPMTHGELVVALFPKSKHCINPGFLIQDFSNTWDNLPPPNDFDKDPRPGHTMLCAAGLHPGANVLVVADDISHMRNIVHYEGEHATLLARDPERWVATAGVHSHPIFGQNFKAAASGYRFEAYLTK